jgi:hypothetical protein
MRDASLLGVKSKRVNLSPRQYAEIASLVFAAQAAFAIAHRLMGRGYAGYTHGLSLSEITCK